MPGQITKTKKRIIDSINHGRLDEAKFLLVQLRKKKKNDTFVLSALGDVLQRLGNYKEAESCYRSLLQKQPKAIEVILNLGGLYARTGRFDEAITCCQKAISIQPHNASAWFNLGKANELKGNIAQSADAYREALKLKPTFFQAMINLGCILMKSNDYDEAIQLNKLALELSPKEAFALNNLASAYKNTGYIEKAIEHYHKALQIQPDFQTSISGYLFTLNNTPSLTPEEVSREHFKWGARYADQNIKHFTFKKPTDNSQRLRIGYVSPDFKSHSVAYFIESLLAHHNKQLFEIVCYAEVPRSDTTTKRLHDYCDEWRFTCGKSDRDVANRIFSDDIDILVDLAGHTADSRLGVFAFKPAPIQVSYLGYPNTTGMPEINYRLTDAIADPVGLTDQHYTETLVRLPHGFLCYSPSSDIPDTEALSEEKVNKHITYGSFNSISKINQDTALLWAEILDHTPGSRLVLKNRALNSEAGRNYILELFKNAGIHESRLELIGFIKDKKDHLSAYNSVDITLDTFPYNGTTTTFEALLMGVPVITLAGNSHVSRVGASILNHIEFDRWVAESKEDYIKVAMELVSNITNIKKMRPQIRERLLSSRLCNAAAFTIDVENTYLDMWHSWNNREI